MLDTISYEDLLSEVLMLHATQPGATLLVEGDYDRRVYSMHIDRSACHVFPLRGKSHVVGVMDAARRKGLDRTLLGLVDADFWHLDQITPPARIVATDYHDLEVVIAVASNALDNILSIAGSEKKVLAFKTSLHGTSILDYMLEQIAPLGALRLLGARHEFDISMKDFDANRFICTDTLTLKLESAVDGILRKSGEPLSSKSRIIDRVGEILGQGHHLPQLCNGHDLISVISVSLRKVLGSNGIQMAANTRVADMLALAFDFQSLARTEFYATVRKWENDNPEYRVFRDLASSP